MPARILIAEDEPHIAEALSFLLERAGYDVEVAGDGHAALTSVARALPDLLILDVMLPKATGFEVLKTLRGAPVSSRLPVVMLTAKGQAQDRSTGAALGADVFLTKPFSNKEVVDTIRSLVAP